MTGHEGDLGEGEPIGADDPLGRGIESMQAAAAEAIAAARAMLDVAEELLTDPRTASAVSNMLSSLARRDNRPVRDDTDDEGGVQRIPVS